MTDVHLWNAASVSDKVQSFGVRHDPILLGFASEAVGNFPIEPICTAIVMAKKGRNSFVKAAMGRKQEDTGLEDGTPEQGSVLDPVPACTACSAAAKSEESAKGGCSAAVIRSYIVTTAFGRS